MNHSTGEVILLQVNRIDNFDQTLTGLAHLYRMHRQHKPDAQNFTSIKTLKKEI